MKPNYTHFLMILDASSSMESIKGQTIRGFNSFIAEQKTVPGKATFDLYSFSYPYNIKRIEGGDLSTAQPLTSETYICYGNTALYDAIRQAVEETGAKLAALDESERPSRVIVVILTDGEENASEHTTGQQVREIIEHQTSVYNWDFTYIGANQDAILVGASVGVAASASLSYLPSSVGVAYKVASASILRSRSLGEAVCYTDEERAAAMSAPDDVSDLLSIPRSRSAVPIIVKVDSNSTSPN